MAVPVVSVSGFVTPPSGGGVVDGGKIHFELSTRGFVTDDVDGSVKYTIAGVGSADVASDGSVSFNIIPNDLISPASTTWKISYVIDGDRWEETWVVSSSPSSQDLADITRT